MFVHSFPLPLGALPKKSKRLLPVVRRGLQEPDILCESPSFWAKPPEGEGKNTQALAKSLKLELMLAGRPYGVLALSEVGAGLLRLAT